MLRSVLFCLFFGCLGSSAALAAAPQRGDALGASSLGGAGTARTEMINQIIDDSGIGAVIEQLPAMVESGFDQQPPPPVGREKYERFKADFVEAFEPLRLRQSLVVYMQEHYDDERFAALSDLLDDPLVKKMTALEVELNTPEGQQEMMQMGGSLMNNLSSERRALVRRLDEATRATQLALDVQMMMVGTMMRSMNKIVPADKRMSVSQMDQMLDQMRMQFRDPINQYTQLGFVYAYRDVDDAELERYIALYESDLGRWSTEMFRDAWLKLSASVSRELSRKLQDGGGGALAP